MNQDTIFNIEGKVKLLKIGQESINLKLYESSCVNGEEKWHFRGYHQSIKEALEHVVRTGMLVSLNDGTDLQQYIDAVNESNQKMYDYLESLTF